MTDLLIELTKNAYNKIGKEIYVGIYDTDTEDYEIKKDKITGLQIKEGCIFYIAKNNGVFEERYLNSKSLEIDIYERIGAICFSAYSNSYNAVREQMENIKDGIESLSCKWKTRLKLNAISDIYLDTLEEYWKKNGREFNINVFIEESFHTLENADKDFEKFCIEYAEEYEEIE